MSEVEFLLIVKICFCLVAFFLSAKAYAQANILASTPDGTRFCSTSDAQSSVDMSSCTDAMLVPVGSAAQRPSSPIGGMVRYNNGSSTIEAYTGGNWWSMGPIPANVSYFTNDVPYLTAVPSKVYNNAPIRTIQTVAAAANGWQISSTRDSEVSYSTLITVTASIASGQSGYIVLEISPTNSTSSASWAEIGRNSTSQVYTLAVALQGVQGAGNTITAIVPAGYYVRLRSVNVTGTPTYSFISGQEVLL